MKFVLMPSLEHITLVKIVVSLWKQNDIRTQIKACRFNEGQWSIEQWELIEGSVLEKVPLLSLPEILKGKVIGFIKPIGLQVFMWMEFHDRYFMCMEFYHTYLPAEFCWTPLGTVDRKRTAEVLVRDETLNISIRYKLACINCLENDIIQLWNNMTENIKKSLWNGFEIFRFWSHNMKRKGLGNADNLYKYEFHECARQGNKVAAEFFLQKLTPLERKESLVHNAKYVTDGYVLCFFLSEMDEDQQIEVFKHNPYNVLYNFLQWPLQNLFIQVANCMWNFLTKKIYNKILKAIICKVENSFKDCNYQKLFRDFWQKSPSALKCLITNEIYKSQLLKLLFDIKDKGNIRLVLKDVTDTLKEKLIYSPRIMKCCECAICDNEWDFLQFFMQECLPSKSKMLKFKEKFEKRLSPYFKEQFETKKHNWDQLFHFSDDSVFQYNKRNLEEDESSSSKRLHSFQTHH